MRRTIVRTIAFATLVLGAAASASAQDHRGCSAAALSGAWAYTETGTVVINQTATPPPSVLAAAVGRYDFDSAGNFLGTQYSSAAGTVGQDTKLGTYTVNHDCTGTLTLNAYRSGQLQRTSVWFVVLADDATEIRGIMTSMVLADGTTKLYPIMTVTAKRLFPGDRGDERHER